MNEADAIKDPAVDAAAGLEVSPDFNAPDDMQVECPTTLVPCQRMQPPLCQWVPADDGSFCDAPEASCAIGSCSAGVCIASEARLGLHPLPPGIRAGGVAANGRAIALHARPTAAKQSAENESFLYTQDWRAKGWSQHDTGTQATGLDFGHHYSLEESEIHAVGYASKGVYSLASNVYSSIEMPDASNIAAAAVTDEHTTLLTYRWLNELDIEWRIYRAEDDESLKFIGNLSFHSRADLVYPTGGGLLVSDGDEVLVAVVQCTDRCRVVLESVGLPTPSTKTVLWEESKGVPEGTGTLGYPLNSISGLFVLPLPNEAHLVVALQDPEQGWETTPALHAWTVYKSGDIVASTWQIPEARRPADLPGIGATVAVGGRVVLGFENAVTGQVHMLGFDAAGRLELQRATPAYFNLHDSKFSARVFVADSGREIVVTGGGGQFATTDHWFYPTCEESGVCAALTYEDCDDDNPCTKNLCEPDVGCVNPLWDDGTYCGPGMVCQSGNCAPEG